ncbi:DUF2267 domain-containing protein [Streptomyces sp. DT24]|uniref:DUF2267 domain-containing protein n=1 Tax=unclassified Streptomyces TaxID=2593676 RepID=UPI0023B8AA0E|nr:DUF2267 domain-containing protein [Streptomyces sp. AM 4-1-1]WEH34942.1 DUF2267 domain-containing protein [Streptomyces sp. AM 4-1-1]
MQYEELIGKVQARAQLPGRGAAERVTGAVLRTLVERLPDGLAGHLLAQLPSTLATAVSGTAEDPAHPEPRSKGSGERFDITAFAGRVAWRTGTSEDTALEQTAAVFEVLDAAVSPELMEKVTAALPVDIGGLLPTARTGDGPEE